MENINVEKLFELIKIINPSPITFNEYRIKCGDADIRKVLISEIEDYLSETNYDGPFEYEPIFYYFKGIDSVKNQNQELLKNLPNHWFSLKFFSPKGFLWNFFFKEFLLKNMLQMNLKKKDVY